MAWNLRGWWIACALGLIAGSELPSSAAEGSSSGVEFFEKRVRPVLAERCYRCHSTQAEKVKGGLLLDSQAGLIKGGEGGSVLVPNQPEKSRLIEAIRYGNVDLQMPPKGKLPEGEISDLTAWVEMGAPWPDNPGSVTATATTGSSGFNLEERRASHWSWKPIQPQDPPSVNQAAWVRGPVDRFILERLEQNALPPAPEAGKETLLRRLSFDLTGLPPSLEEVDSFIKDPSEGAYEKVVDHLLSSPRFGERWARHWLDLVRYSETLGHEFDYANPNAWRYRDYVIRALNQDLPYRQFVLEHVAGDLLPEPRRSADGLNESVIGTAFFWLGQRDHSPVDVRQHQAELIDNQIDVLCKTFLGLTVACARCHDHKFDPVPTRDYYALYGILSSSRYSQSAIDSPTERARRITQLEQGKHDLRQALGHAWLRQIDDSARYLIAAQEMGRDDDTTEMLDPNTIDRAAAERNLDPVRLDQWLKALDSRELSRPGHPLFDWAAGSDFPKEAHPEGARPESTESNRRKTDRTSPSEPALELREDGMRSETGFSNWMAEGEAFANGLSPVGDFMVGDRTHPVARILEAPALHSGILSRRLQGILRSPTFTITNRYLHVLAAGREARINLPIDNFTMIRDPIYGGLKRVVNHDDFRWVTMDLEMWQGHRAYLEFSDVASPDPADDGHRNGFDPAGYLAVQSVAWSTHSRPPATRSEPPQSPGTGTRLAQSVQDQAQEGARLMRDAIQSWAFPESNPPNPGQIVLLNWLLRQGLLDANPNREVAQITDALLKIEAGIQNPTRVPALVDGTGLDEHVFVRGNSKLVGELAPRRFLEAIEGPRPVPIGSGSGRWELAQRMVSADNPFVTRVMVNRVWLHLFGRGLVATPDDFGKLGQPPTHPELLDWLANWYRTDGGWSTKRLIRMLVTSSTYRMSSKPADPSAEKRDPDNLFWHRMPVRRLEGEAIRDSILALSGRLDPTAFGPPVPIHLTPFMEGRGRPPINGPLDGAGRRSIYVEVRRNFISPMLRAFDTPVPFTTVGRRTVSNVPAQSLILLNDPFVIEEARRWARRVLAAGPRTPAARIDDIYRTTFSRSATASEIDTTLGFLRQQAEGYGIPEKLDDEKVWADLCHVILNTKEFVFLN